MIEDTSTVGQLIYVARLARTARAELLAKHGLFTGQDVLLKSLQEEDGQSMGSLAARMGVRPPTVTKMVTRMSAQGLVMRKPSPNDNRQSNVFISQQGLSLTNKIDKAWRKSNKIVLKTMKRKDQRKLKKLLSAMADNLNANQPQ